MNNRTSHKSAASVYFYTLHKCASSLFSAYVLPNTEGLCHIDYAREIHSGGAEDRSELDFEETGHVYGPIRISAKQKNPVRTLLVDRVATPEFVRDKKAVFLVRDPRDILVSSFYSFGVSHVLSPIEEIREFQILYRAQILSQGIDAYALAHAQEQADYFKRLDELVHNCPEGTLLRYEDMIENFPTFARQLSALIPLRQEILLGIESRTRPTAVEDPKSHRRSGRVGGFRKHLSAEAIENLNRIFSDILRLYNYPE